MKSGHFLPVFLATAVSAVTTASAATNLITAGGQINNAANWDNGLPSLTNVGTIAINANINAGATGWIVNHTGGNATSNANRAFGGGTIWTVNGASITFFSSTDSTYRNWNSATDGYTLNMQSGSFNVATLQLTNSSTLNLSGGTMSLTGNIASNTGTTVNISGGILDVTGNFSVNSGTAAFTGGTMTVSSDFNAGAASVTFGLGNASLTAATISTTGATSINFVPDSAASLTITAWGVSDFAGLWDAGRLKYDGGNAGSFSDHFSVSGSTLSLIPEPQAALLGGLGLLALLRRRR